METQTINGVEIIRGLDIEEYHKSPILSHSKIHYWISENPLKWKAKFVEGQREEGKEADHFVVGRALDCLLFDGKDAFAECFVAHPREYPATKKATKAEIAAGSGPEIVTMKKWTRQAAYCEQWEEEQLALGKSILSLDDMRMIRAEAMAVARNPLAKGIITAKGAEFQVSLRWQIEGIWFQARPDVVNFEDGTWDDLKTTRDLATVNKNFWFMGYDMQSGLIWDAMRRILGDEPKMSRHIYVDKSLYPITEVREVFGPEVGYTNVENGLARALKAARTIENARATGQFEIPQRTLVPIIPPPWIQNKIVAGEELSHREFLDTDAAAETLMNSI